MRPLQEQVVGDLRDKIERGDRGYKAGDKLPKLDDLAKRHGVGKTTMRHAVRKLEQAGLVITVWGQGIFVRRRPPARRHGNERYSRSRWLGEGTPILVAEAARQGRSVHQLIRELTEVPAPAEVAERFGIDVGTPVFVRRRTTVIDGIPNQMADSYYELAVANAAPLLREVETGPGGGFARLEEAGFSLDGRQGARIREMFSYRRTPTEDEQRHLELPDGSSVIDLIRTTTAADGRVVEVMVAVLNPDMVIIEYDFPIPD
jgi:GntR family transcriptional regulator